MNSFVRLLIKEVTKIGTEVALHEIAARRDAKGKAQLAKMARDGELRSELAESASKGVVSESPDVIPLATEPILELPKEKEEDTVAQVKYYVFIGKLYSTYPKLMYGIYMSFLSLMCLGPVIIALGYIYDSEYYTGIGIFMFLGSFLPLLLVTKPSDPDYGKDLQT